MTGEIYRGNKRVTRKELNEQEIRIAAILGDLDPEVGEATLARYRDYLERHLKKPCRLTGIEDFDWEERYVFGFGEEGEYERLKQTRASYTDEFDFLGFDDYVDTRQGLFVEVRRVSDKKTFSLPLADLEAIDKNTDSYRTLHDFSVWFVNY